MDLNEDEDDTDCNINDLLNSLNGIEQCFVADCKPVKIEPEPETGTTSLSSVAPQTRSIEQCFAADCKPAKIFVEPEPEPKSLSSVAPQKRSIEHFVADCKPVKIFVEPEPEPTSLSSVAPQKRSIEPVPLPVPAPKKICLRDPRLAKIRTSVPTKAPLLPVPNFVKCDDPLNTKTANTKEHRPKKAVLKPIVISKQLSQYLKANSSLNVETKQKVAITRTTWSSPEKFYASRRLARTSEKDISEFKETTASESKIFKKTGRENVSESTIKNGFRESSQVPLPVVNSKDDGNENLPDFDLDKFKDILQAVKGLPAKETNSVANDPRIEKLVVPPTRETFLYSPTKSVNSDPPVQSDVSATLEESQTTNFSKCASQPLHKIAGIEEVSLEVGLSEKASNTARRGKKTFLVRPAKSKPVRCNDFPQLPVEILIKIFTYLPLSDKKTAKLVCKLWYDACNIKLITMRQRFVCCGMYDTASILRTLVNSGCCYFNLEFHRVDFCDVFSAEWKQLGPRIHALYFVDCILGEETLGDVIVNCTEMEHLSFSFERLKVPSLKLFSLSLFEKLFKRRVQRPKLVSMDIQINSNGWLSNAIVSNLFAIYPNVSRLGFTCHSLNPVASGVEAVPLDKIDFSDLWSSKTLTFSPVLKFILSPPDCMEKLRLDAHTKGARTGFAWQLVISQSKFTRLRELVIEIDLKKLSAKAVVEFCIAQPQLKNVTCKIIGPAKLYISLFLSKLLDSCTRLRNLSVTYNAPFLMSYELFRCLVTSKLKSLSIESSNVLLAPQIADEIEWPINEHLRSLNLSQGVGNSLKNLFIVIFRNLRCLELHSLTDELLQLIWKVQKNLVTLKLAGVEECTIDGFCGVPENKSSSSIRYLQNLEYLVLETVNTEWQVYGNVFSEFQFPKLRYICVDIEGSNQLLNDLMEAMQNLTELEGVSITCSGIERRIWLQLNENWKKLRYLRIVDKESSRFKRKQYHGYFKTSPKLRALFHEFKETTESYYYDVLEKTVKIKTHRVKYRISSEKVGGCFLDWLWF